MRLNVSPKLCENVPADLLFACGSAAVPRACWLTLPRTASNARGLSGTELADADSALACSAREHRGHDALHQPGADGHCANSPPSPRRSDGRAPIDRHVCGSRWRGATSAGGARPHRRSRAGSTYPALAALGRSQPSASASRAGQHRGGRGRRAASTALPAVEQANEFGPQTLQRDDPVADLTGFVANPRFQVAACADA